MPDRRPRGFLSALVLILFAAACAQTAHAQEAATPAAAPVEKAAAASVAQTDDGATASAKAETPRAEAANAQTSAAPNDARAAADGKADFLVAEFTNRRATSPAPKSQLFAVPPDRVFAPQDGQQTGTQTDNYTPLTSEQKMKRAFKSAFLSPAGYAWTGFNAALTEWGEDDLPHKDREDRIADWGSRFAIQFGRRATRSLLGSGVYPALFKQEPRYIKSTKKGIAPRALYAASRVFVTRGDNGNSQFNISRVAGNISASALSNLWEQNTPGHDRIGAGPTFRRVTSMFLSDALFNLFREFW
ncbi:MAG TPA: hypothetical protein VER08_02355 [Pyrinomonadaceae bacterium]|nr:hypothetical protein [Pyrinomonadaceae bacterium]